MGAQTIKTVINTGAGQVHVKSARTGENKFDFGIGESNTNVIENKNDYTLGHDTNSIGISGGIGTINLKFKEVDVG